MASSAKDTTSVPPVVSNPITLFDRFVTALRAQLGTLVAHAVTIGGGYVWISHVDFTKLETGIVGAVAVAVGALVNKIRTTVKSL